MSKGLGKLQQQILERVTTKTPVSTNWLCWELATAMGRVKQENSHPLPTGFMDPSFYKSFCRAVGLLKKRDLLEFSERKIETFKEIADLYPYRTQNVQIKALREGLLPWTVEYLKSCDAAFNVKQNEHFLLKKLSQEQRKQLSESWKPLWNELAVLLGQVPEPRRILVFNLMVKGNELATELKIFDLIADDFSSYTYSKAMGHLLTEARKIENPSIRESALYARILSLYVKYFPPFDLEVTGLKSRLVEVVEIGAEKGNPRMTAKFKAELLNEHKDLIEALPGHKSLDVQKKEWLETEKAKLTDEGRNLDETFGLAPQEEVLDGLSEDIFSMTQYSPLLDQLIHRDVFRPFEFVSAKF